MKRLACLAICLAAACGDDGGTVLDAALDAPTDAAVDAEIDAPLPVFSGSFSVLEVSVLNPGQTTVFGQGVQLRFSFSDSTQTAAPILEQMPGSPLGCKVWEMNAAQTAASMVGVDEGPVTITFNGGTNPQTPPAIPACIHTAAGYVCADTATASGGGTIAVVQANATGSITDTDIAYNAANSAGRYVRIVGAAMAANNGVFPIVAIGGANTIVYANPRAAAETLPAAAQHVNIAAAGPIPSAPDPGFLADDSTITVAHTMGGGNHVANFSLTSAPGTVGDDFTLDASSLTNLSNPPRTGAAITYTCATNCAGANASGSLINIETTDAPLAGLSPFAMPPPVTKKVQIRCSALGSGTITIPAEYSAKLMSSGATRIQSTFMRGALLSSANPPVTGVAGHAIVGFTAPAQ